MQLESRLEEIIENETEILGQPILLIGRQVPTKYGKFIDLLGVNSDGDVLVIELKRDRTPRDVVAQTLDYASWVQDLSNGEVRGIFDDYQQKKRSQNLSGTSQARDWEPRTFDEAFDGVFDRPAPEELNVRHELVVVASEMDEATERLVGYLSAGYGVPINVLLLDYFDDGGREYLARTWLIDDAAVAATRTGAASSSKRQEVWNGQDWYVSFGEEPNGRSWKDALTYGFVSAGGGNWYSRSLQQLPLGARVFTHIPKSGYVGIGEVVGEPRPFNQAVVHVNGSDSLLCGLELDGNYVYDLKADEGQDVREWVVPVRWLKSTSRDRAFWQQGLFANQNSACKLRNEFTITEVCSHFGVN